MFISKLYDLTGIKSIDMLYRDGCLSHYDQVIEMNEKNLMQKSVKFNRGKSNYVMKSDIKGSAVSPILELVNECNKKCTVNVSEQKILRLGKKFECKNF